MNYFGHQMGYEKIIINKQTYFVLINKVKGSPDQGKIEFGMIQKKSENNVVTFSTEITK
jgi:hypothetical protein